MTIRDRLEERPRMLDTAALRLAGLAGDEFEAELDALAGLFLEHYCKAAGKQDGRFLLDLAAAFREAVRERCASRGVGQA